MKSRICSTALVFLIATAVASGCGSSGDHGSSTAKHSTTTKSSSSKVTTPRCRTADLRVDVTALPERSKQRFAKIVLTNHYAGACTVTGFPALALTATGGTRVPVSVQKSSGSAGTVKVDPGGQAVAEIHWFTVATDAEPKSGACEPAGSKLAIRIAGDPAKLTAPWTYGPVCQRGHIDVTPFT